MSAVQRALCLLFLLLTGSISMHAQSPSVRIESPSSEAMNVGVRPVITIKTSHPIIQSSISWRLYAPDSTPPFERPPHTILIIPSVIEAVLDDSLFGGFAVEGEYDLVDDTTLTFTPYDDLGHFQAYSVQVRGLQLQVGLDSPSVSTAPLTFTTLPATHKVVYTSLADNPLIRCRDTMLVMFNRPISSLNTPSGNLIDVVRLDSISSGTYITSPTSCNVSVDPNNSRSVRIWPQGGFTPGSTYFLDVNAGDVTGDSLDDRQYSFSTRSNYSVVLNSISADENNPLNSNDLTSPPSGTYYYSFGEDVLIGAMDDDSTHVFHHWECPELPSLHMNTDPVITISQGCVNMQDLHLVAIYQPKQPIDVTVASDGCTILEVFSSNGTSLGGPGSYTLQKDDYLIINAYNSSFLGMPACLFKDWASNDSRVHGQNAPMLRFYNRGTSTGIGVRSDPVEFINRNNGVCVFPFIDDGFSINRETAEYQGGENANGIVAISPEPCEFVGNSVDPIYASATIAEEYEGCFCLDSVIIRDPYNALTRISLGCVNTHSIAITPTTPATSVYFIAKRKEASATYNLTVETEVTNIKPLSGYPSGEQSKRIGPKRDVTVRVLRQNKTGALKLLSTTDEDINSATFSSYFPCNALIRLETQRNLRENGYGFTKWYSPFASPGGEMPMGSTYDAYPIPSTLPAFTVKMDGDKSARASFRQNFFLRRIGFYADGATQPEWFLVNDLKYVLKTGLDVFGNTVTARQGVLPANSKFGTRIGFEFSEDVQQSTVEGAIDCTELSERIDLREKEKYVSASSNLSWTDSKMVIMNLYPNSPPSTGPFGIPAGERFNINIGTSIQNASGETLDPASALTFAAMTELPNVKIRYASLKALSDMGDLVSAPDLHTAATVVINRGLLKIGSRFKRIPAAMEDDEPCYTTLDVNDDIWYNFELHDHKNPDVTDHIITTLDIVDVDSESGAPCLTTPDIWEILIFLGAVIGTVAAIYEKDWVTAVILGAYAVSQVIRYIPNDADYAGYHTWSFNWDEHWFGARPGVYKKFTNQNVEVETSYNLYID